METKLRLHDIAILAFGVICIALQVYAVVDCDQQLSGRHADPDDSTCKNYTLCIYIRANNSFISYNYVCPGTSLFNPSTAKCTTNYTCNVITVNPNRCRSPGRFPTDDATCKTYYLCVSGRNGTLSQYNYTCPGISVFSPLTRKCTTLYTCR